MAASGPRSSAANWRLRLTLVIVSTALTLIALEAAVRVRQWFRYGTAGTSLYSTRYDAAIDLPIPLAGEATRAIRINALGFRGPEIPAAKPAGVVRLAFAGSSTTFCAEVTDNDHAWPDLVWQAVQARWPDRRFDYVNAAFPGYTTEISRRSVMRRLAPLDPDVIVIYEGINDISRDTRQQASSDGIPLPVDDEEGGFAQYSLTYRLILKNLQVMHRQRPATAPAYVPRLDELTARFAGTFDELVAEAGAVASVVAVATLSQKVRADQPPEVQLANANTHRYYMPHMSVSNVLEAYAAYNAVIARIAANRGALLIDGEDTIPADDRHFRDSVHFSDDGSRRMAARVAAALIGDAAFQALVSGRRTLVRAESP